MRVVSSAKESIAFIPASLRQTDCIASIAYLFIVPLLSTMKFSKRWNHKNKRNSYFIGCRARKPAHLRNSCASSSLPLPSWLPIFCSWDRMPRGESGDFPSFAFKIILSNSQEKQHSLFKPGMETKWWPYLKMLPKHAIQKLNMLNLIRWPWWETYMFWNGALVQKTKSKEE